MSKSDIIDIRETDYYTAIYKNRQRIAIGETLSGSYLVRSLLKELGISVNSYTYLTPESQESYYELGETLDSIRLVVEKEEDDDS